MCLRSLPDDVGAPKFLRVDVGKKTIGGAKRTTEMRYVENSEQQVLMLGTEMGYAWTIVLDKTDGTMTLSIANRDNAFLIFGYCTPA
jgi:hypothetical protein